MHSPLLVNSTIISCVIDLLLPLAGTQRGLQKSPVLPRLMCTKWPEKLSKWKLCWGSFSSHLGIGTLLCRRESIPTCFKIWQMLLGWGFTAASCAASKHLFVKWVERGKWSLTLFLLGKHSLNWPCPFIIKPCKYCMSHTQSETVNVISVYL